MQVFRSKSSLNLSFPLSGFLCAPAACQPYFGKYAN